MRRTQFFMRRISESFL